MVILTSILLLSKNKVIPKKILMLTTSQCRPVHTKLDSNLIEHPDFVFTLVSE